MRQYLNQISLKLIMNMELNLSPLTVGITCDSNDEEKALVRLPDKRVRERSFEGETSEADVDLQFLKFFCGRPEGVLKRDTTLGLALLG